MISPKIWTPQKVTPIWYTVAIVGKFGGDNDKVDEDFGKKRFGNE